MGLSIGGGFKYVLCLFHLGEMIQKYFSNELKAPASCVCLSTYFWTRTKELC